MELTVLHQEILLHELVDVLYSLFSSKASNDHKLVWKSNLDPRASVLTLILELIQLDLSFISKNFTFFVFLNQFDGRIPLNSIVIVLDSRLRLGLSGSINLHTTIILSLLLFLFIFLILPKLLCFFLLLEFDHRVMVVNFDFAIFKSTFVGLDTFFFNPSHLLVLKFKFGLVSCLLAIHRLHDINVGQACRRATRCFKRVKVSLDLDLST